MFRVLCHPCGAADGPGCPVFHGMPTRRAWCRPVRRVTSRSSATVVWATIHTTA